jgi:hypothetical protein
MLLAGLANINFENLMRVRLKPPGAKISHFASMHQLPMSTQHEIEAAVLE